MESGNAPEAASKTQSVVSEQKSSQPSTPVPDLVSSATSPAKAKSPAKPETAVSPKKVSTPTPKTAEADGVAKPAAAALKPQPIAPVPVDLVATKTPQAPVSTEAPPAKSKGREEKARKKDDKSVDHVLRALNSLNTTEEKLAAMCKKYADLFDEHRKLQLTHKQTEKRCSVLQREKEQLQGEYNKAILTRSRLENLCRELQRQNKAIKDESLLRIREEEEKRKEVAAKFQSTMNEITTMMQQNNDKNIKLRDDNIDMTSKLKSICEQYEIRQQQVDRISKQMQLEQQLNEAKMSKLKMEMAAEREMLLREKQQLLLEVQQYQQRVGEMQATEMSLRGQITTYNDKYDEFQKALARSNDVFGGFKGEMEKMTKKICKLEKETSSWKQRWERSHAALLEMGTEKQRAERERETAARQLAALQSLCRTLQQERAATLKQNNPGATQELQNHLASGTPELSSAVPETVSNGLVAASEKPETISTAKTAPKTGSDQPDAQTLEQVKNIINVVNDIGAELNLQDDSRVANFNKGVSSALELIKTAEASQSCQRLQSTETASGAKPAAGSDSRVTQSGTSPLKNHGHADPPVCLNANQKSVIVENCSAPGTGSGESEKNSVPQASMDGLPPAVVDVSPPMQKAESLPAESSTPNQNPAVDESSPPVLNGDARGDDTLRSTLNGDVVENGTSVSSGEKSSHPSTPVSPKLSGASGKAGDSGKKVKEVAKKKKK